MGPQAARLSANEAFRSCDSSAADHVTGNQAKSVLASHIYFNIISIFSFTFVLFVNITDHHAYLFIYLYFKWKYSKEPRSVTLQEVKVEVESTMRKRLGIMGEVKGQSHR